MFTGRAFGCAADPDGVRIASVLRQRPNNLIEGLDRFREFRPLAKRQHKTLPKSVVPALEPALNLLLENTIIMLWVRHFMQRIFGTYPKMSGVSVSRKQLETPTGQDLIQCSACATQVQRRNPAH